jgi:Domain of unknown function (DUF4157)
MNARAKIGSRNVAVLQRQCACGQHSPGGGTCSLCAKQTNGATEPTAALVNRALADPGRAVGPETRAFMEPRLGHDFSGVRVHTDTRAAAAQRNDPNQQQLGPFQ